MSPKTAIVLTDDVPLLLLSLCCQAFWMDYEDFTWNMDGVMHTNIVMPTKRAGQDWPEKIWWCFSLTSCTADC